MPNRLDQLRRGERWWLAEVILRSCGLILLYGSGRLALLVHRLALAKPPHQPTPQSFALCAAAFLLLSGGLALVLVGPGLLRRVPIPRRRLI